MGGRNKSKEFNELFEGVHTLRFPGLNEKLEALGAVGIAGASEQEKERGQGLLKEGEL